ncbi:hypothetical protein ACFOZ5_11335 [Marinobacter lacisalsi]|uniref:Uncharacterized protein n=1 Tax=Marinobacter lacisalsi TaxID=475979 RepID=A0ABV8QIM8_9GAMM
MTTRTAFIFMYHFMDQPIEVIIVFIFTVYTDDKTILGLINEFLMEQMILGRFSIHRAHDGGFRYVSEEEDQGTQGFFRPCYTRDDAKALAIAGVPVLDVDGIIASMDERNQENFFEYFDVENADNIVVDEIIGRLIANASDPVMSDPVPTLFQSMRRPVLHPAEYQLLQGGHRQAPNVTINTTETIINYPRNRDA